MNNMIVFGDVVLSNILCQEFKENEYKLIIVDGLGARRFGFKLWLHTRSKLFTKFRIKKQWKKLLDNYNDLKKTSRIEMESNKKLVNSASLKENYMKSFLL